MIYPYSYLAKKYNMTKNIITRFAPSPTGNLHVGNARTALINYLYSKKHSGKFLLRIDDTDKVRSTEEFKDKIIQDLKWLGFEWDDIFYQSDRLEKYEEAKNNLIAKGRLYPCYETGEELEIKRKLLLKSGNPPIYDRAALSLTEEQKQKHESAGRKPHYRFLIEDKSIAWNDMVKGEVHYEGKNLSDPVLVREDGSMTYMLCSCLDDAEYNISHIIRGEDHVSNTAIQLQLFEAMGYDLPEFGHLSLVKSTEDKISKRKGGFEISSLRDEKALEPMPINNFFAFVGTSLPIGSFSTMEDLASAFDISKFSNSPTTYMPEELLRLNHKIVSQMSFADIQSHLKEIGGAEIDENFWNSVKGNIDTALDAVNWWKICHEKPSFSEELDQSVIKSAIDNFPSEEFTDSSWKAWTSSISEDTGAKGRNLFMPLRIALTGMNHGPEMAKLLPLIGKDEALSRLQRALC